MEKHFPRISEKGKLREVYPNFQEFHTGTILFHVILGGISGIFEN